MDMSVPESLLRSTFGFDSFREGQREVIDALLAGESALAVFPTGAGKSLCYQLPALALEGITLVVSPLIALMKDQIDFLARRGVPAARLDSSLSEAEMRDVTDRLRKGSLRLLYVAPERFNNERFLALLDSLSIALFAIDEAHCISEWGHNFRPDYLKLAETARRIRAQRVLALTATATPSVIADIRAAFAIAERNTVVTGFYRSNLTLLTTATTSAARDALLVERLRERPPGPTLVYVTLQSTAERVAATLARHGLPARAYHAGMDSTDRADVQDSWQRSDTAIVVATIAFGMGIDKANVRYVYHYNMPKSLEGYVQEIGRAGRDGLPSTVELFASSSDLGALESFSYGDTPTASSLRGLVAALLASPEHFDVGLAELSARHDLRPLVLRTALTYLELDGALRQGTPFYAAYEARPRVAATEFLPQLAAERRRFVEGIIEHGKRGRTWLSIRPDEVATALGSDRVSVVRALEDLAERSFIELRASEARLRFRRLADKSHGAMFTEKLVERFLRREALAIGQMNDVVSLVTARECQTNALVAHFGERRATPCQHCAFCLRGHGEQLPIEQSLPPISAIVDDVVAQRLAAAHPRALGEPRQLARFLSGLSSPATSSAKLSRHALFGVLEQHRFVEVLAWCEMTVEASRTALALEH
jgi:ATP-dependent DNA helicase RecQ